MARSIQLSSSSKSKHANTNKTFNINDLKYISDFLRVQAGVSVKKRLSSSLALGVTLYTEAGVKLTLTLKLTSKMKSLSGNAYTDKSHEETMELRFKREFLCTAKRRQ